MNLGLRSSETAENSPNKNTGNCSSWHEKTQRWAAITQFGVLFVKADFRAFSLKQDLVDSTKDLLDSTKDLVDSTKPYF